MTTGDGQTRPLDISIVTVSHNHLPLIKKCLASLYATSWSSTFETVVVDNACSDRTGEWVARNYPQVTVIRNEARQGYAANGNKGMRAQENGRYVMLLNPDVQCLPGILDTLVAFMDGHPDVGIAGPKLLNPDGTLQPSCRRFSTPASILIRGLHLDGVLRKTGLMRRYLMDDFDHQTAADVDWVTGALMIVRREAIARVGMMDERYFLYSDDQDWCCRMWQGGWRVCYVPQAQAIHAHMREGIRKPWSRAAYHQLVSAIRMFHEFGWKLSRASPTVATRRDCSRSNGGLANTHQNALDADERGQARQRAVVGAQTQSEEDGN
jgi:N-acetylglucosaminyl-diphospho-decaprenol L-rhamnosyltransferase